MRKARNVILVLLTVALAGALAIAAGTWTPILCERSGLARDVCINLETSAVFFVIELILIVIGLPLMMQWLADRRMQPARRVALGEFFRQVELIVRDYCSFFAADGRIENRDGDAYLELRASFDAFATIFHPETLPDLVATLEHAKSLAHADGKKRILNPGTTEKQRTQEILYETMHHAYACVRMAQKFGCTAFFMQNYLSALKAYWLERDFDIDDHLLRADDLEEIKMFGTKIYTEKEWAREEKRLGRMPTVHVPVSEMPHAFARMVEAGRRKQ
jgi:hypothetical protein